MFEMVFFAVIEYAFQCGGFVADSNPVKLGNQVNAGIIMICFGFCALLWGLRIVSLGR